jgi:hypothetical protein
MEILESGKVWQEGPVWVGIMEGKGRALSVLRSISAEGERTE